MIKAIETRYAGCHFRSRTEARWARFFDALGIEWEHEPEGFETSAGRYLPDFRLHLTMRKDFAGHAYGYATWFEVKPPGAPSDTRHAAFTLESKDLFVARGMPRRATEQPQYIAHLYKAQLGAWDWDLDKPTGKEGIPTVLESTVGGSFATHAHGVELVDGFSSRPDARIDAAYSAALSERFGT